MATITSAATGNWSAGATWGGGVPPTSVDDAVIGAGHTVTLDVDATILTLTGAANTASNLSITTSRTLTCTNTNGILSKAIGNGGGLVRISGTGITVNINSNLRGTGTSSANNHAVAITSNCTVNINGNITNFASSGSLPNANSTVTIAAAATVNIIGDISGGAGTAVQSGVWANNSCILNVTGNLTGTSFANCHPIYNASSLCTINITGDCTADLSVAIFSNQNSNINITGNCTSNNVNAILAQSSTVTVVGTITASNSAVGINVGPCTISTPCVNSTNGVMAVLASTTKIYSSAIASWRFATDVPATNKFLYSAGVALGNPATTDVRNGTTYGASSELTGTLIVPSPSNVVAGVQTDNTVGTYSTTPALIATEIFTKLLSNSDFNTSGSFGKLIKDNVDAKSSEIKAKTDLIPTNPASVQSVGAIVASYNV
jgi:hypothetical protein